MLSNPLKYVIALLVIILLPWLIATDRYRLVMISIFHGLAKLTKGETTCNVFVRDHMVFNACIL